jgi:hypothetical protein
MRRLWAGMIAALSRIHLEGILDAGKIIEISGFPVKKKRIPLKDWMSGSPRPLPLPLLPPADRKQKVLSLTINCTVNWMMWALIQSKVTPSKVAA